MREAPMSRPSQEGWDLWEVQEPQGQCVIEGSGPSYPLLPMEKARKIHHPRVWKIAPPGRNDGDHQAKWEDKKPIKVSVSQVRVGLEHESPRHPQWCSHPGIASPSPGHASFVEFLFGRKEPCREQDVSSGEAPERAKWRAARW